MTLGVYTTTRACKFFFSFLFYFLRVSLYFLIYIVFVFLQFFPCYFVCILYYILQVFLHLYICNEIFHLLKKDVSKPNSKNHYQPDLETQEQIIEVKSQTRFTSGTAGEKILGCPFKYCEIPELYGKNLLIICVGGAETASRKQYGNLKGKKCSVAKQEFLDFFKLKKIEFAGASDLLLSIISN